MNINEIVVPTGKILITLYNVITKKYNQDLVDNMFLTAGKNALAASISGTTSDNKGIITYCSLGTDTTAPALGQTGLLAEIGRKAVSVRSSSGNVATFQTFFTPSECNGTLREAGLYGDDASASLGTGTLFCRAAINRTKTSSDTLSLSWSITIS